MARSAKRSYPHSCPHSHPQLAAVRQQGFPLSPCRVRVSLQGVGVGPVEARPCGVRHSSRGGCAKELGVEEGGNDGCDLVHPVHSLGRVLCLQGEGLGWGHDAEAEAEVPQLRVHLDGGCQQVDHLERSRRATSRSPSGEGFARGAHSVEAG